MRGRESVEHDARRNHATAAVVAETTAAHAAGDRLLLVAGKQADAVASETRKPMEVRSRESVGPDARRNHKTTAVVAETTG